MLDSNDLKAISEIMASQIAESERRMMTYVENTVGKDLKIVAEGLSELIKRVPDVDRQETTEYRVSTLEHVAENHAGRLNELEKKAQ